MTAMDERGADARALVRDLEGLLLVEAARAESRAAAGRFTGRLPWLTDSQREEVERQYTEEHMVLTRRAWDRTAARSRELRAEYEEAYRVLQRRAFAWCLVGAALFMGATLELSRGWG
ncbi:hypothetical protein [Streptomyces flavofungini]|uniref:hypothetical protein n=1 Tax=Streptomyces flavofungini TaxID=68200 RepID=UPI0025B1F98B|nr:hypothetical protein [Streptomyces flavofungini]WJV47357.1 hypothetical protein QUY26_18620 [Streptomyces flavofungini]